MTAFDCKVTGATSTAKIAAPVDPTWCDPTEYKAGTCKIPGGAKRPLYAYNSESNIVWKGNYDRPGYVSILLSFFMLSRVLPFLLLPFSACQLGFSQ
jgi:hypothetical protein